MFPYIGFEINDLLRHRSRTLSSPPAISCRPQYFKISDETSSIVASCVAKKPPFFNMHAHSAINNGESDYVCTLSVIPLGESSACCARSVARSRAHRLNWFKKRVR